MFIVFDQICLQIEILHSSCIKINDLQRSADSILLMGKVSVHINSYSVLPGTHFT